ncbi:MAG: IclR family transcriptional regulator [Thermoanaerobacterales bacterium]|jgi:IclR family KDG regulon transcriptional repressor|nr:IclR family transcriptional regulator [Thermoanaerobacterales bacterium]
MSKSIFPKYTINSIARAVNILELFSHDRPILGISEIARELSLQKSAVYRIVQTLVQSGILEKQDRKYKLGFKLYKLGILAQNESELIECSLPHLEKLTSETGETSNLVVLEGSKAMYVAQKTSDRLIRMFTKIGAKVPPHCCGAGKILLSDMSDDEVEEVIDQNGLAAYTQNTISDKQLLFQELEKVRVNGYAVDNEEREQGVLCIAAPIKNASGRVIASISLSWPKFRFSQEITDELILLVKNEGNEISIKMGYKSGIK